MKCWVKASGRVFDRDWKNHCFFDYEFIHLDHSVSLNEIGRTMENYIVPAHLGLTLITMALYLLFAIRFFRKKDIDISAGERTLIQVARYGLLMLYLTGLFMSVTFGMSVHKLHHAISILPAILVVGIRYLPVLTRRDNSARTYAWLFAILFVLMLVIGATSRWSPPQF